jgi:hypothetical protein
MLNLPQSVHSHIGEKGGSRLNSVEPLLVRQSLPQAGLAGRQHTTQANRSITDVRFPGGISMVSRKMRNLLMVAAVLLLSLSLIAATLPAKKSSIVRIRVAMTGAQEAPGPGDPDGKGTATFKFAPEAGLVCWTLTVSNITLPATAAHIHIAPKGSPGPVVIPLSAPGADGKAQGCASASKDLLKAIVANPAAYYVNVHNVDFPPGAVRAQLGN